MKCCVTTPVSILCQAVLVASVCCHPMCFIFVMHPSMMRLVRTSEELLANSSEISTRAKEMEVKEEEDVCSITLYERISFLFLYTLFCFYAFLF